MAEQCLVCGNLTTTLNFQLNACRACAAFYRRSLETFQSYRCQNNNGNCDVTKKVVGKPICRYCRYQKCLKVGMKSRGCENSSLINNSPEKFPAVEIEHSIISDDSATTKTDFTKLFNKVDSIFQNHPVFVFNTTENYTKTFSLLLEKYLKEKIPQKELIYYSKVDPAVTRKTMENYVVKCAQLINSFQPFAVLPFTDKQKLFHRFLEIFAILEKSYNSCQYFGNNINDLRILSDNSFIDLSKIPIQNFEKNLTEKTFFIPIIYQFKNFFLMFKKANISLFDLSYMCQNALWLCYDILDLSLSTEKLAEEMLKHTANDLHNYFEEELKMPYYAIRQSKLFKIVQYAESIIKNKNELHLARDIFQFEYKANINDFDHGYYEYINNQQQKLSDLKI